MEWYETPVEMLRDRAIEALGCNELDVYRKNLLYAHRLVKEREYQEIHIPDDVEDVSVYSQSLGTILNMTPINLRTMSDDILELSHFGLSADCAYISKGYKHLKDREKTIGLYKRAISKLQAEKDRRFASYGAIKAARHDRRRSRDLSNVSYV